MNTLNEGGKGGLGMVLAILGIGLGLLGILFGVQGQKEAKKAADDVKLASEQMTNLATEDQRLAYALRDLDTQTKATAAAVAALEAKIKTPPPSTNRTSKTTSSGAAHSTKPGMYSIKPNDSLGKIAKEHGVSVEAIEKANPGVDSRRLKIGTQIKIP